MGLARSAAAERCRAARQEVSQAEQRLGLLLRQLAEQRSEGVELAREVAEARAGRRKVKKARGPRRESLGRGRTWGAFNKSYIIYIFIYVYCYYIFYNIDISCWFGARNSM